MSQPNLLELEAPIKICGEPRNAVAAGALLPLCPVGTFFSRRPPPPRPL